MARGGPSTLPPASDSDSYTSSSEDVEEDESGTELTPALDAAILQTLGKIRRKEGVYGTENVLQEALQEAEKKAGGRNLSRHSRVTEKPYLLADHHRAALLSGLQQKAEDDSQDIVPLTNVQTQRIIRADAINAFKSLADDGSEGDDEDEAEENGFVLKKRAKDEKQTEEEDEEYRKFLLEMGGGEQEVKKILGMGEQPSWRVDGDAKETPPPAAKKEKKKKKEKGGSADEGKVGSKQKQEKADEDFLMNYILNRGWIDRSEKEVPTYDEIVGKSEVKETPVEEDAGESSHPWGVLDEDEFDERAEEFETAYNFRYEEPGASNILSHPRVIPSLVRRPDDTRKTKRQAREERKAAERAALEEETRRLKGKKRREMESQLKALEGELGDKIDVDALEKVFEGDWDETEWDRLVGGMLARAAEEEDQERPTWDDMDDMDYDEAEDNGDYQEYKDVPLELADDEEMVDVIEDGPVNMDADFIDEKPGKKQKKSKKGKGKAASPVAEPDLSVAERAEKVKRAMDEYKALDHEDMIGDLPTRFHYTQSSQVDLGLTPAEILLATDAELNELAGVKYIAPYRRGGLGKSRHGLGRRVNDLRARLQSRKWGEEGEVQSAAAKSRGSGANEIGRNEGTKRKWGENGDAQGKHAKEADGVQEGERKDGKKVKRLGKKQRMKARLAAEKEVQGVGASEDTTQPQIIEAVPEKSADPGQTEGEAKKRRKKKKKKGGEGETVSEIQG